MLSKPQTADLALGKIASLSMPLTSQKRSSKNKYQLFCISRTLESARSLRRRSSLRESVLSLMP